MADAPTDAVIDEILAAVTNTLRVGERSDRAIETMKHTLKWYATEAAAAPRQVEITLIGTLSNDGVNTIMTLPDGATVDIDDVLSPGSKGVTIKDLG